MSLILVDSSVWIEYFRSGKNIDTGYFNEIIDNNSICINDVILTELIPQLKLQKENEVIDILQSIRNIPLVINWEKIAEFQYTNFKNGINKVGIPDLIILQNVIDNDLVLYSLDKHFKNMSPLYKFKMV
jgi:predicted nucleic acid-binding protein